MSRSTAAPITSKSRKSRSSITRCSEKYSCNGTRAAAVYQCAECETMQCAECERKLHELAKCVDHFRTRLVAPSSAELCQQANCEERNYANVVCEKCGDTRLCWDCDRKTHTLGAKKHHARVAFCPDLGLVIDLTLAESGKSGGFVGQASCGDGRKDGIKEAGRNDTTLTEMFGTTVPAVGISGAPLNPQVVGSKTHAGVISKQPGSDPAMTEMLSRASEQLPLVTQPLPRATEPLPLRLANEEEFDRLEGNSDDEAFVSLSQPPYMTAVDFNSDQDIPATHRNSAISGIPVSHGFPASPDISTGDHAIKPAMSNGLNHHQFLRNPGQSNRNCADRGNPIMDETGMSNKLNAKSAANVKSEQSGDCLNDVATLLEDAAVDDPKRNSSAAVFLSERVQGIDGGEDYMQGSISAVLDRPCFLLANQNEELMVRDEAEFLSHLSCDSSDLVKVVSIFGNTGDGKSHTLNHAFLGGREVFPTSHAQVSCTAGVWAVHDGVHRAVLLDTEGLLGVSTNENQRTRLLLKVLAVSDIVIYRTRADRLHSDLFRFLGNASCAYLKHFRGELASAARRLESPTAAADPTHSTGRGEAGGGAGAGGGDTKGVSAMCPAVVIFHETQHTEILQKGASAPAEQYIRERFAELGLSCEAFSSIHYVGTRTHVPPTDFKGLLRLTRSLLANNEVRCPRQPGLVYRTLKILNEKFIGEIEKEIPNMFPDQYFTCRVECLACRTRCYRTMNHECDQMQHEAEPKSQCRLVEQYDNAVYTCKECFDKRGRIVVVVPKTAASDERSWLGLATYAWSGYVLECKHCGVIYRSRRHWYGNDDPQKSAVRTEIRHVWPDSNPVLMGTHNAARRLLDGLTYVSDTIAVVSAKPTKLVSNWVTDQIAPPYWRPNSAITECHQCKTKFSESLHIHHCRACGEGFCAGCSSKRRAVPERNWGMDLVRVCDTCFRAPSADRQDSSGEQVDPTDPGQLMPRKVGEVIGSTVGALASVVNYPYAALRDAARPAYWKADEEITTCIVCAKSFGALLRLHHCRACGQGVCALCSPAQRAVPSRGWDHPVRVCAVCHEKKGDL